MDTREKNEQERKREGEREREEALNQQARVRRG